jgi:DNA replicative helicase MCM subunit Mcm2 (Cdc46/Mcm family)
MDDYGVTAIATAYQNLKMVATIKFLKTYTIGYSLKYREQLIENASHELFKLEIDYDDLDSDNSNLSNQLLHNPEETIPLVNAIYIYI